MASRKKPFTRPFSADFGDGEASDDTTKWRSRCQTRG
ncbi:hypothetical protein V6Z11_D10G242600 [Gossypium hirsutum]